ncbi:MAG: TolC family protein [Chitinispirillaceae bacterium]|nr:TolC family protein [Chitinispirillaceae bacterium]
MFIKAVAAVIGIASIGSVVSAQPYTLNDYINALLSTNPQLNEKRALVDKAREEVVTATRLMDPVLSTDIPLSEKMTPAVSLEQGIPWVSKLVIKKRITASTLAAAQMRLRDEENDLLSMIRADYYRLYEKGKVVDLLRESLELINQATENAQVAYANGTMPQATILKFQLEAAQLEDRILQTGTQADAIRDALVAKTGLSRDNMDFPDHLPTLSVPDSLSRIIDLSVDQNPLITALAADSVREHERVKLRRAAYFPDAMIGVKVNDAFSSSRMPMAMAGISLPIWAGKNHAAVRSSQAELEVARRRLERETDELTSEATTLFRNYREVQRRIALIDNVLLPTAEQVLSSVEAGYRTSTMSVLEYLDAQRALIDIKIERVTLETNKEVIAAEIVLCCLGATGQ